MTAREKILKDLHEKLEETGRKLPQPVEAEQIGPLQLGSLPPLWPSVRQVKVKNLEGIDLRDLEKAESQFLEVRARLDQFNRGCLL